MLAAANRLPMLGMLADALALGGCASMDTVRHAQDTADHAMAHAQSAEAAAQAARAEADRAGQKADQDAVDVRTFEAKVDHFIAEERAENAGERHRHHYHHRYVLRHHHAIHSQPL